MNPAVTYEVEPREGGGWSLVFRDRNGDQCGGRICASREEAETFGEWQIRAVPTGKQEW